MTNNTIAEKIITLRIKAKLSQKKLCSLLDITQGSLSSLENGSRNPSINVLQKLSEIGKEYNIDFMYDETLKNKKIRTYIKSN